MIINRNVLKKYFENKEQEVVDIIMTLFNDELILEADVEVIKIAKREQPPKG